MVKIFYNQTKQAILSLQNNEGIAHMSYEDQQKIYNYQLLRYNMIRKQFSLIGIFFALIFIFFVLLSEFLQSNSYYMSLGFLLACIMLCVLMISPFENFEKWLARSLEKERTFLLKNKL